MDNYSDNGFENFVHEDVLRLREKHGIRRIAKYIGITYTISFLLPYLLSDLLYYIDTLSGAGLISFFGDDPGGTHIYSIIASVIIFVLPFLIMLVLLKDKTSLAFSRPKKGKLLPMVFMGMGICAFGNITTNVISSVFYSVGIRFTQPDMEQPSGFFGVTLVVISASVVPALVEEFAMRGAVMGPLRRYGESFAILVSAIIFGMVHGNFVQIPFAFIVGLGLGYAVIKTGSLWTGILIHFINNFISVGLDYLLELIPSSAVGSAVIYFYFAICFVLFFVGLYMLKTGSAEELRLFEGDSLLTFKQKMGAFFSSPYIIFCIVLSVYESIQYVIV